MLSKKYAESVRNILILVLIGVFSFFVITSWLPDRGFIQDSIESVKESSNTVMKFSAATLSTSLAISALPDDFATPLADSLADMNIYFHDDSAGCAAQVARSYHARIIFTGMAAEPINGFIDRLRRLLPQTPIAMVDKQGTVYRMDPHQVAHTR